MSSIVAIGSYIAVLDRTGAPIAGQKWQNFVQGQVRTYMGEDYVYAGFGFSGGSVDLEAAAVSATVLFSLNELDLNIFKEASDLRHLMRIRTVWLDGDDLSETAQYSEDIYQILGFSHEQITLSIRLGSPLDAIEAEFPRRRLTTALVGQLPSSGTIPLS
jgi:hypothetical protein